MPIPFLVVSVTSLMSWSQPQNLTTGWVLVLNPKDSYLVFGVTIPYTSTSVHIDHNATVQRAAHSGHGGNVLCLLTHSLVDGSCCEVSMSFRGSHAIEKMGFSLGNTLRRWKEGQTMLERIEGCVYLKSKSQRELYHSFIDWFFLWW